MQGLSYPMAVWNRAHIGCVFPSPNFLLPPVFQSSHPFRQFSIQLPWDKSHKRKGPVLGFGWFVAVRNNFCHSKVRSEPARLEDRGREGEVSTLETICKPAFLLWRWMVPSSGGRHDDRKPGLFKWSPCPTPLRERPSEQGNEANTGSYYDG